MQTRTPPGWRTLLALPIAALLPFAALAGKPTASSTFALKATVYSTVIDEQDTVGYFHDGGVTGCPDAPLVDAAGITADAAAATTASAWNFFNWNAVADPAGTYDNGSYCASTGSCLRAEFNSSDKTFTLDTRTTANPLRKFTLDFTDPYDPNPNAPSFGPSRTTAGLFEVLGSASMTGMAVCSTHACPEAREIPAKFWFSDPVASDTTWRVDWTHIRVLRVSPSTWYFIADACDGSQVAGLSKLVGSRTRPRETNQGYYLIPIFIGAEKK